MKLIWGLLLSLSFSLFVASSAQANIGGQMCGATPDIQAARGGGGDPTPWPWGLEVKMTWSSMSGIWYPMSMDCGSYFIFKAGKPTASGEKLMKITQFDPQTCQVVASGAGYEYKNIVYASMISGNKTYDLTVRAFNEADVKANMRNIGEQANKKVVVIHMYPKGEWESRVSYEVAKVRNAAEVSCKNLEK